MERLHVEAEGVTNASPEVVWALISDANRYSEWGPWNDGGYDPPAAGPSQPGSIQWFRFGRRTKSVEEVLVVEAARRLAYTVIRGLPVRNYQAEVTLMAVPSAGTTVRWTATWDRTLLGWLIRRKLAQVYADVVRSLVAAADGHLPPEPRP